MDNDLELNNDRIDPSTGRRILNNQVNPYSVNNPPENIIPNAVNFVAPFEDRPVNIDTRQSFAADANPLHSQQPSCHPRSFFATLLLCGGIASIVVYFSSPGSLTFDLLLLLCCTSYISYLLLACICNDLLTYLSNITHGVNFEGQYQRLRASIGRFAFTVTCYHYQTHHHTSTVTDSNGHTTHQNYTTKQKVVTHTAKQYFIPVRTDDISGQVDRIRAGKYIVFINFLVNYRFKDDRSQINFNGLYLKFQQKHRRDAYQDYTSNYETPDLIQKQTFYVGELSCSYQIWFIVFSIFGLIWPYILWIEKKVDRFHIDIMKSLTL